MKCATSIRSKFTSNNMSLKSLKHLARSEMLSDILQTDETKKATDDYILNYIQNRPSVLEAYLESHPLYHVFFREEDPDGRASRNDGVCVDNRDDIHLLKSFATFSAAQSWVIKNGREITHEQEENYGTPIVLTIIKYDNKGSFASDEVPTGMYMISANRYPTYAFSTDAFNMLIREHIARLKDGYQSTIIPYWLFYCDAPRGSIKHLSISDFENILASFSYTMDNDQRKAQHMDDMIYFSKNPDKLYSMLTQNFIEK